MTCWDCKYHKPISVAFSFCKFNKRGISCAEIPNGCGHAKQKDDKEALS